MRKMVLVATVATFTGFCFASVSAFATLRYNIWKSYGPSFQLGYIIGYLDAVSLSQHKDPRVQVPTGLGKNFDGWVKEVNEFYADPANEGRSVPDAIYTVGDRKRTEILRKWGAQRMNRPLPSPSAKP